MYRRSGESVPSLSSCTHIVSTGGKGDTDANQGSDGLDDCDSVSSANTGLGLGNSGEEQSRVGGMDEVGRGTVELSEED